MKYQNYELIISDDCSTDDTLKIIKNFNDPRINIIENKVNAGRSVARNVAIEKAKGEIIFFTDDDVKVSADWITNALKCFDDDAVVGMEGKIVYVDSSHRHRYGDRVVENYSKGSYMTANAAYRKKVLLAAGLFDIRYLAYEDRELALRILKYGKILYVKNAVVYHQLDRYTLKSYMAEVKKVKYWAMLINEHNEKLRTVGRVYEPFKLVGIFFPQVILIRLFTHDFRSKEDWYMFLLLYPRLCYERVTFWYYSAVYKLYLIMQEKTQKLTFKNVLFLNSFYLILATGITSILGFIFWTVVARSFRSDIVGLATTLLSISGLISLWSLLGFDTVFVRFLAKSKHRNSKKKIDRGLAVAGIATALVTGMFCVLLYPLISPKLSFVDHNVWYLLSFFVFTIFTTWNTLTNVILIAYRRTSFILAINVIFSALKMCLPFIVRSGGPMTIYTFVGITQVGNVFLSVYVLKKYFNYSPSLRINFNIVRETLRYSSVAYIASILNLLPDSVLPLDNTQ